MIRVGLKTFGLLMERNTPARLIFLWAGPLAKAIPLSAKKLVLKIREEHLFFDYARLVKEISPEGLYL
jgi:hypothetical protein